MAKFRIGDLVILDKDYAEEYGLYSGVMKVKEIRPDRREYMLSALDDENVGVLLHMDLEDKIKPYNILYPSKKLLSSRTISILGTEYTIETHKVSEDEYMKEHRLSGYCCEESKRIVIADMSEKEYFEGMDDAEQEHYRKKTLRHELVHAFLNESGLSDDASTPSGSWAKHEEMVDWFAIQSPKIFKTFEELNTL